ncbi:MAG: VIT domain-containing protein, partial [Gemmataceae bacterium]
MNEQRIDQGEQNLANLLKHAYQPEQPDESFAARVKSRMHQEVRQQAPALPTLSIGQRLAWVVGIAALLAGLSIPLRWLLDSSPHVPPAPGTTDASFDGLTAKARPPQPSVEKATIGQVLETKEGQRRRVALPDGTILFVNEETRVRLAADRELVLESGEIYVETAPKTPGAPNLIVRAGKRELVSLGTRFGVRATGNQTDLLVTQGKVRVEGSGQLVHAGQQWLSQSEEVKPAPRFAHALDWTRDLVIAAESPLVPGSQYAGGALIAIDPEGQEAKLSLRRFHVDVYIEDGFARTTIDQTYFNHQPWRLEGTFYFPLPADASLSRLAMYVDQGKGESILNEGGMAERNEARAIYDQIVYSQRDPALLEWLDGSTFKMKVFPLEGRQEKRILLSYTQRLESLYGREHYRFPAGHNLQVIRDWSFQARVKKADGLAWNSPSHKLDKDRKDGDLILTAAGKNVKGDKDLVLDVFAAAGQGKANSERGSIRTSSMVHEGARYLMLRYRPELLGNVPSAKAPGKRHWIFLFESSGDRDPLVARVQVEIIRELLGQVEHDDTFAVLTANTKQHVLPAKPATADNIQAAIKFLEGAHLIGALDLQAALSAAKDLQTSGRDNYLVHVGTGIAALGERREDELARKLPEGLRYVGVGVGKRWSRNFMKTSAERTGGFFTQINPDEAIGWRTFELYSSLNLPRLLNIKVADEEEHRYLTFASSLSQGEELCAVTRLEAGQPLPATLVVTGNANGQPYRRAVPVGKPAPEAAYLPRLWAKLEIDRLLADDSRKHHDQIVELSKAMYVMTPFTSLLVLENDAMYKEYNVDRGRQDHWALYKTPAKIETVYEPDPAHPGNGNVKARKPRKVKDVLNTIVFRDVPAMLSTADPNAGYGQPREENSLELMSRLGAGQAHGEVLEARELQFREQNLSRLELFEVDRATKASSYVPGDFVAGISNRSRGRLAEFTKELDEKFQYAGESSRLKRLTSRSELITGKLAKLRAIDESSNTNGAVNFILRDTDGEGLYFAHEPGTPGPGKFHTYEKLDKLLELSDSSIEEGVFDHLLNDYRAARRLYNRPYFNHHDRLFCDLVLYAPGLNTTMADVEAVVDAEAEIKTRVLPGRVEPAARKLIETARQAGWRTLEINGRRITFDGQGRYFTRRTLPFGLEETEICDGTTILHLYPEIGLAARRPVSRFHRLALSHRLPWVLAEADDLAYGHDITLKDERTVVMAPRDAATRKDKEGKLIPYGCFHLVFAADGTLAERRLI